MVSPSNSPTFAHLLRILACPRCGGLLRAGEDRLTCAGCGQGYPTRPHLDLLTPGKRPPNEGPGDSAEMARRRVAWERQVADGRLPGERAALDLYLDTIVARLRPGAVVVDLGCGTGDVLRRVGERYGDPLTLLGLDVSLPMLDRAYRALRHEPRAIVARASTRRRLPLGDGVVDVALRRLAPALPDEMLRVLRTGGALVAFSYAAPHWHELYDALPDLPRPRAAETPAHETLLGQGFTAATSSVATAVERLTPQAALDRLLAGPATFHVDVARDLPRLQALAAASDSGLLALTTHATVTVGVK